MKILNKIFYMKDALKFRFYRWIIVPIFFKNFYNKISNLNIKTINETVEELVNTNNSIGRFGDGELSWMFGKNNGVDNFEKKSTKLSNRLKEVFYSNENNFMITLPDSMKYLYTNNYTSISMRFWQYFFLKNRNNILKLSRSKDIYYNTSVTRPYIDYNKRILALNTFNKIKKIWNNKNILIIEGSKSRLGYNDDLFDNSLNIKRIECPYKNSFESYDEILEISLKFLSKNKDYLTLISLGPSATILSYDLHKNGYRAIDVGHIDVEYEWYLIGAKEKINLPDKYVNEVRDGHSVDKIKNDHHNNEIIYKI